MFRRLEQFLKKYALVVVILAVGWTIATSWTDFGRILDVITSRLSRLIPLGLLASIGEILFIGGAAIMALSLGKHIFRGTGLSPWRWLKAIWVVRGQATLLIQYLSTSRLFRLGFNANWIGAILGLTGLPLLIFSLWFLPWPTGLGWALVAVVDIILGLAIRVAVRPIRATSQEG